MISFISWVNSEDQYSGLLNSCKLFKDVEFVKVDNNEAQSLVEAYSIGQSRAIGNIKVYCHQDVRIIDNRFIDKLNDIFKEDNTIGFAGPIGNTGLVSGSWWFAPGTCRGRVMQGGEGLLDFGIYDGAARQLDGLMMVTDKQVPWKEIPLDGIHFVDLWACRLMELKGYTNWIFSSFVQHLSGGENQSESYRINMDKYRNFLNIV